MMIRWRDDTLSCLCAQSRAANAAWKEAGCTADGPHFKENGRLHLAVRKRVRFCAASSRIKDGEKGQDVCS